MALDERLELDIVEALRGIDSIESALGSAVQSFRVALAEALDILGSVTVGEVDAGTVTSAIDAAVDAADTTPVIEGDASAITEEIDAAVAGADAVVAPEVEVDNITGEIDSAVAAADTTVTLDVEADTSAAAAEISELGSSAESSVGGVGDLSNATAGLSAAAGAATGDLGGLGGAAGAFGSEATAAAGVTAAFAGSVAELFHAAVDSESAQRRLTTAAGEFAEEVQHVDIGGLNEDLGTLAERTGQDDEALKLAAARFFDLGRNAGVAGPEVANSVKQLEAISITLATANPALGQAGDVADRLTTAFARGGRALAPYGIALSAAEINTRALADTGKSAAEDLTIFEKAQAGLNITMERTPDLLAKIGDGMKNPQIQVQVLQERFRNALETIGQPLIIPVLDLIEAGVPIATSLAELMSNLGQVILPGVTDQLALLGDALSAVSEGVGAVKDVQSELKDLASNVGTDDFNLGDLLGRPEEVVPHVVSKLKDLVFGSDEVSEADKKLKASVDALAAAFGDSKVSIDGDLRAKTEQIVKNNEAVTALARLGLTYEELAGFARRGKDGSAEFNAELSRGQAAHKISGDEASKLKDTLADLSGEFQKGARAALDDAVAHGEITKAARDNAVAHHELAGGGRDYLGALAELNPAQAAEISGQRGAATAADEHKAALKALDDELNALLTTEEAAANKQLAFAAAQTRAKEANLAYGDAVAELVKKQGDATASAEDLQRAQLRVDAAGQQVVQSALGVAAAHDAADEATAKLNGTTETAEQKARNLIQAFSEQAAGLAPDSPLRSSLAGYVADILGIPLSRATEILADPSQANAVITEVENRLRAIEEHKYIAHVTTQVTNALGGISPFMAGGPIDAGQFGFVGEREPEIFVPRTPGVIGNQRQLEAAIASEVARQVPEAAVSAAQIVNNVTVNEVAQSPEATAFAIAARLGELATR